MQYPNHKEQLKELTEQLFEFCYCDKTFFQKKKEKKYSMKFKNLILFRLT